MRWLTPLVTCFALGIVPGLLIGAEVRLNEERDVEGFCLSPDFSQFITVEWNQKTDPIAHVKNPKTGRTIKPIQVDKDWGAPQLLSPDGKTYVALSERTAGNRNTSARLFRVSDGEAVAHFDWANEVVYSPDGMKLAFFGYPQRSADPGTWIWDIESNKGAKLRQDWSWNLTFSPDGKSLALSYSTISPGGPSVLSAHMLATRKELLKVRAVRKDDIIGITDITYAPNGKTLATSGGDRKVKLWDLATRKERASLEHLDGVRAVAFHPGGKVLASLADDNKVRIWDIEERRPVATAKLAQQPIHGSGWNWRSRLMFSPDGKYLGLTYYWGRPGVKVWSVEGINLDSKNE